MMQRSNLTVGDLKGMTLDEMEEIIYDIEVTNYEAIAEETRSIYEDIKNDGAI